MSVNTVRKNQGGYTPLLGNDSKVDSNNSKNSSKQGLYCVIPFGRVAWATVSLPFFAFIFCVMWSIAYHFDTIVTTHCKVANLLPSISAAIGTESPQAEVWQIFLGVHAPGRFLIVYLYQHYYSALLRENILWLSKINCVLAIIENLALLGLSFVSSTYNYPVHEKCFMTFVATSEIYMMLCCYLLTYHCNRPLTNVENRSLKLKKRLLLINIVSFFLAGIFFVRHNAHCEPYIYTLFAFFEYIVVLTNMGFHMTACYDLFDRQLHFGITSKSYIL